MVGAVDDVQPDPVAQGICAAAHERQLGRQYFTLSGTSPAAAVVSGVAALMLQQNPSLTPSQVKHRLRATALPQLEPATGQAGYSAWQQGAGYGAEWWVTWSPPSRPGDQVALLIRERGGQLEVAYVYHGPAAVVTAAGQSC